MSAEKIIKVNHVTRVEGHGNIHIKIRDGRVEECQWQVVEAPRFFEAMLRERYLPVVSFCYFNRTPFSVGTGLTGLESRR